MPLLHILCFTARCGIPQQGAATNKVRRQTPKAMRTSAIAAKSPYNDIYEQSFWGLSPKIPQKSRNREAETWETAKVAK